MSDEWLRIIEEAHDIGIPASATMMYGHVESNRDIAEHFRKIVELQKKDWCFYRIHSLEF